MSRVRKKFDGLKLTVNVLRTSHLQFSAAMFSSGLFCPVLLEELSERATACGIIVILSALIYDIKSLFYYFSLKDRQVV